jgi:hypothetical protein
MAFKNMKLNKKEFITILIPTSHQQARERAEPEEGED